MHLAVIDSLLHEARNSYGWGSLSVDYSQHDHGVFVIDVRNSGMSPIVDDAHKDVLASLAKVRAKAA